MIPLPWSTRWAWPGLSLWAVAVRIGFVGASATESVLQYLVGANERHRAPIWFGTPGSIARVGEQLSLSPVAAASLFCADDVLPLHEREFYRLALRWCPECLADWFHSPLFQDARVSECPLHRQPLVHRCPRCRRNVDPLRTDGLQCSECHHPLATPPKDWRKAFGTTRIVFPAVARTVQPWTGVGDGDTVLVAPGNVLGLADWRDHVAWRCEGAAALWDAIAGRHRECAVHESQAATYGDGVIDFTCPVAAALLLASYRNGVLCEARGQWPTFNTCLSDVPEPKTGLPGWVRPLVAHQHFKLLALDALQSLAIVAERGWRQATWSCEGLPTPSVHVSSKGILIADVATDAALLKAIGEASPHCGYR